MEYRREIDGLRALAVVPVILFHAGFESFNGGYVGVDVFFVISGFLITTIIASDLAAGRFSFANFYERRARRILPALVVVVISCLPAAWWLLTPSDMIDFARSVMGVALFASNIVFWLQSGYFDSAAEMKPLLHTWSLATEEQFYIFFPILLAVAWRVRKSWAAAVILAGALASLAIAQWGVAHKPAAAFFLLPTRAWELAVGALLALYVRQQRALLPNAVNEALSLAAIGALAYAVVFFDKTTPFPGVHAMVPVLATAVLIACANQKTVVGRALGCRWMVGIGLVSYSAYLWHQPLFAFARHATLEHPGPSVLAVLAALSFGLAYVTWRFVEQPFRKRDLVSRRTVWALAGASCILFAGLGYAGVKSAGFAERIPDHRQFTALFNKHDLWNRCGNDMNSACVLGASGREPTVAVFGDSHANFFLPAFDQLGRAKDVAFVALTKGGCPPLLGVEVRVAASAEGVCENFARRQIEYARQHGIKRVFLAARWSLYADGAVYPPQKKQTYFLTSTGFEALTKENSAEVFARAMERTVSEYNRIGAEVVILAQVPQQRYHPRTVYYRIYNLEANGTPDAERFVQQASVPYDLHMELQALSRRIIENAATSARARVVDFDAAFCGHGSCLMGNESVSYYRDMDHLNPEGVRRIVAYIAPYF